jgi:hypothetical protein
MVPVVMFCQECGNAIKGQFACTCIECVSKRVEASPSASTNTAMPKLTQDIVESCEPCDYCVDRQHSNCKNQRTEYFPSCFKGKQLRHC